MSAQCIILCALGKAIWKTSGLGNFAVEIEDPGRQHAVTPDLTSAIGWFTMVYPVHIAVRPSRKDGELLARTWESFVAAQEAAMDYAILSQAGETGDIQPLVSFNYAGDLEKLTPFAEEVEIVSVELQDPDHFASATCGLSMDCWFRGGTLVCRWDFDGRGPDKEYVQELAKSFRNALSATVSECSDLSHLPWIPERYTRLGVAVEDVSLNYS